jgi:hypothetical protein
MHNAIRAEVDAVQLAAFKAAWKEPRPTTIGEAHPCT